MIIFGVLVVFASGMIALWAGIARLSFKLLLVILSLAVFAVVWLFLQANTPVLMGPPDPFFRRTPWKELFLFCAMISGMSSKYLWDLIEQRRKKNSNLTIGQAKYSIDFDLWDFLQPLLVAGIVFSGVLAFQKNTGEADLLFSFQNGFFWQTILKSKVPS